MGKLQKILLKVLQGNSDNNISFESLCNLLSSYGFSHRIKGDHHIFSREDIQEIINIQPKGSKAKSYQVKQVRGIITSHGLGDFDEQ